MTFKNKKYFIPYFHPFKAIKIRWGLVALLMCFFFTYSWGVEVELTATVNKKKILVGEKITLLLTLTVPADKPYQLPILNKKLGDFLIKDYHLVKKPHDNSGLRSQTIAYTLVGYVVGKQVIPAIHFRYDDQTVSSDPIVIEVESVLGGSDQTLEPLKPNLVTQGNLYWWVYPIAILLIVIIVYLIKMILINLWRQRKLPYYDSAHIQIMKLGQDIYHQNFTKKNYFKFDQIVKNFYADYADNPKILSMTSKQIVKHSQSNPSAPSIPTIPSTHQEFFNTFFSQTDLIKFQASEPDSPYCHEQLEKFKEIIQAVKKEAEEKKSTQKKFKPSPTTN